MKYLPRQRVRHPESIRFALRISDMVSRGDIDLVVDSLKNYWRDKKPNPWHRVLKDIEQKGSKTLDQKELDKCVVLIRDGLFAAMDMLSFCVPLDVSTSELLDITLKASSWKEGRRNARNYCANRAQEMIAAKNVDLFVVSGLEHDGFRYLVPDILRTRLEMFEAAQPKLKDGAYDLMPLHRCLLGRLLLRELNITAPRLQENDPRAEQLLTLHSHMLLDMELEESSYVVDVDATAQTTLNGEIVEEEEEQKEPEETKEKSPPSGSDEVQVPLTEYIPSKGRATARKTKKKRKKSAASTTTSTKESSKKKPKVKSTKTTAKKSDKKKRTRKSTTKKEAA